MDKLKLRRPIHNKDHELTGYHKFEATRFEFEKQMALHREKDKRRSPHWRGAELDPDHPDNNPPATPTANAPAMQEPPVSQPPAPTGGEIVPEPTAPANAQAPAPETPASPPAKPTQGAPAQGK